VCAGVVLLERCCSKCAFCSACRCQHLYPRVCPAVCCTVLLMCWPNVLFCFARCWSKVRHALAAAACAGVAAPSKVLNDAACMPCSALRFRLPRMLIFCSVRLR
jgi:hypothetical protein